MVSYISDNRETMNPNVAKRIEGIRNDKEHGAGWLSREALSTLNLAISQSQVENVIGFIEEIKAVAKELVNVRPSIVPISNHVGQFLHQIILESWKGKNLSLLKSWGQTEGKELIKLSEQATARAIEYGSGIISVADTVITCSYSSTVCMSFELARDNEETFRVMVAESKSLGKAYGEITVRELKQHGIPVQVISDEQIPAQIAKANKALVGADSILADGSFINGVPTLALAQAAKKKNVPFYTVCDTAKFDVQGYLAKESKTEPGFDRIPPDLITGIITEKGILAPGMVKAYVASMASSSS